MEPIRHKDSERQLLPLLSSFRSRTGKTTNLQNESTPLSETFPSSQNAWKEKWNQLWWEKRLWTFDKITINTAEKSWKNFVAQQLFSSDTHNNSMTGRTTAEIRLYGKYTIVHLKATRSTSRQNSICHFGHYPMFGILRMAEQKHRLCDKIELSVFLTKLTSPTFDNTSIRKNNILWVREFKSSSYEEHININHYKYCFNLQLPLSEVYHFTVKIQG